MEVEKENDQGHVIAEAINRDQDQDLGIMKDILPINIIAQDHQGNANPHRLLAEDAHERRDHQDVIVLVLHQLQLPSSKMTLQ